MNILVVDKDKEEYIFKELPRRYLKAGNFWISKEGSEQFGILLKRGSIKKMIDKDLTWTDEPFKY